jgi:hypothetical protein
MSPADLARVAALVLALQRKPRPGVDGRAGVDGKPGRDGVDGKPGRDGVRGLDGKPGAAGRDGVDGAPGRDGARGAAGLDGRAGEPGTAGPPGPRGPRGEDGRGLPRGGQPGQIAVKRTERDFDVIWSDLPAMGGGGGGGGGGSSGPVAASDVSCSIPGRSDLPDVQAALASLFYVPLSVGLSGGGTYERGQSIASRALTWSASKALASQSINGAALDPADRALTVSGPFTTDTTWALSATATSGESASSSTALAFRSRRHWGVSAATTLDDAGVLALAGSELATARQQTRTLDASGGRYLWFAWPAEFGAPAFWVGGLLNTDWTETVRDVVNAYGHTHSYRIYRSGSIQFGAAIGVEVR